MLAANVTAEWQGKPLTVLADLIEKRKRIMGEDAQDAVVATSIDVVRSLRGLTRKAPVKANEHSFRVELTPYVASWERHGSSYRRVVRMGAGGSKVAIYPVNNAGQHYVKGERVQVWKITPVHAERWTWQKNRNKGCWYVFAQSEGVARRFAIEHVSRLLRKESGMGKTALGFAMARLSTRSAPVDAKGPKAQQIAAASIHITSSGSGGMFTLTVCDNLEYAKHALKGGDSAISLAMMKASNKIAGRLAQWEKKHFFEGERTTTPFPEIKTRRPT